MTEIYDIFFLRLRRFYHIIFVRFKSDFITSDLSESVLVML